MPLFPSRRPLFLACLLFALAVPLSISLPLAQEKKQGQATPVGVDAVSVQPVRQTVSVIGRLVAAQAGGVAARTSGPIAAFHADVGDKVARGEIIAQLVKDAVQWSYQLRKAEVAEQAAALESANASLALQRQELKRLENLRKSAAFSQARYDDKVQSVAKAEGDAARAKATLNRAKANLKLAEINLYNTDVRAPYAGVVSEKHTSVGAYVNTGQAVVSMIDDENLEVEAAVPANRATALEPGAQVTASLGPDQTFDAVVRAIVPQENPLTRTRTVRFLPTFAKDIRNLAMDQSVTLNLPVGALGKVPTVHKDAVLNRGGRKVVFVAVDGQARMQPVQLGEATGTRFIVKGGLKAGDLVVVRGNERLRPGQKIQFKGGQ